MPLPAAPPPQPTPGGNPFDFDSAPPAEPPRRQRPLSLDDEEEDDSPPASRVGRGRWSGFAAGCTMAKWGAVVELAGVAYLFLLTVIVLLEAAGLFKVTKSLSDLGAFIIVPFFLPILVGTAMMALGRLKMADVPQQSGGGTVISLAGVAGIVRFILLFAAAILLAVAFSKERGGNYAAYAVGAMFAGWAIGTLAELTSVAGVAAAGSAMQNRELCSTAAFAGLLHLILGLVFVFLFLVGFLAGLTQMLDRDPDISRPNLTLMMQVLVFAAQIVFTYSQYVLYSAGESIRRSRREDA
jgi:hypothetical protein